MHPAKQAINIQIAVGTEGLQRLNASTLTDEDKKDPTKIYKLFDDDISPKTNFRQLMNSSTGRATRAVCATSANLSW